MRLLCSHKPKRSDHSGETPARREYTRSLVVSWMNHLFIINAPCKSFSHYYLFFATITSTLYPLKAVLRYLRTDKRMSSVTFNNLVLADGQQHRLLFHLRGMQQQGPGGVELHLDCRLVETVRDLPAAFQGLPAGYGMVELKTMQAREQVTYNLQHFHTIMICLRFCPNNGSENVVSVHFDLFYSNRRV